MSSDGRVVRLLIFGAVWSVWSVRHLCQCHLFCRSLGGVPVCIGSDFLGACVLHGLFDVLPFLSWCIVLLGFACGRGVVGDIA